MPQNKPKLFRDPVHNIITFDRGDSVERALFELVQTRAVQRLRRIRQLGFAHLVYHGAEHSRFTHSMGVFYVAKRMLESLELDLEDLDRYEVLAAALLHDIGHGPLSHTSEEVTAIDHETYTARLIRDPDTGVHRVLHQISTEMPNRVARYFESSADFPPDRRILRDIVSSQLDADRLDYILRDGLKTGVKISVYDFERIQKMLSVYRGSSDENGGDRSFTRLAVGYRAREAVEDYLIARFHMFKQVYLHRTVRAADKMLGALLRRVRDLFEAGNPPSYPDTPGIEKFLRNEPLESMEFLDLDDTTIWSLLKQWRASSDDTLSRLATGLLDRELYKTIELENCDPVDIARTIDRVKQLAEDMGLDPEYSVLTDRAQNTPYHPYDPESGENTTHIPVIARDGTPKPIETQSDFVHLLGRDQYKIRRLCLPGELRTRFRQSESP